MFGIESWPAWCALTALVVLLVLIMRFQVQAFVALLVVSIGLGLATGMEPVGVLQALGQGVGEIAREVILVLALGAVLGRVLEASRAAEVIAETLLRWFGERHAPLAILLSASLIGLPILFNVGFLLLLPIVYRLHEKTGRSLLNYGLPMAFSLGLMHSLVPPHPGIVYTVGELRGNLVAVMLWGALLAFPMALVGWFGPGRLWAGRQHITMPPALHKPAPTSGVPAVRSFFLAVLLVLLPLVLSALGFGIEVLERTNARLAGFLLRPNWSGWQLIGHSPAQWLQFLGHPVMALATPVALGMFFCSYFGQMNRSQLAKLVAQGLEDVGAMAFLFLAAGAFKQILQASGAGEQIAHWITAQPLSPVLVCYILAVAMRIALGSATAAIVTAAPLLAPLASAYPGQETLLILSVACGITFMTQPADSGFWMVKEYFNLSVSQVMIQFNLCRMTMSLVGLAILLTVAWLA